MHGANMKTEDHSFANVQSAFFCFFQLWRSELPVLSFPSQTALQFVYCAWYSDRKLLRAVKFTFLIQDIKKRNVSRSSRFTTEPTTGLHSSVTLIDGESSPLADWRLTSVACNWFTQEKKITMEMSDRQGPFVKLGPYNAILLFEKRDSLFADW